MLYIDSDSHTKRRKDMADFYAMALPRE